VGSGFTEKMVPESAFQWWKGGNEYFLEQKNSWEKDI
jgi:hypothetical protein